MPEPVAPAAGSQGYELIYKILETVDDINNSPIKIDGKGISFIQLFNKILKLDNPELSEFKETLQIMGGFKPVFLDNQSITEQKQTEYLERLETTNIFSRLNVVSKNNIVAVSEMPMDPEKGQKTEIKETLKHEQKILNSLYNPSKKGKQVDDCKLILPSTISTSNTHEDINKKILNVHFDGDGPIKYNKTISQFLDLELYKCIKNDDGTGDVHKDEDYINKLQKVEIICGDTNITAKKTSENIKIGQEIADYLEKNTKSKWIVIMANIEVGKFRRGFMLVNQQLKKSARVEDTKGERDGTILAIKVDNEDNIGKFKTDLDALTENYIIYSSNEPAPASEPAPAAAAELELASAPAPEPAEEAGPAPEPKTGPGPGPGPDPEVQVEGAKAEAKVQEAVPEPEPAEVAAPEIKVIEALRFENDDIDSINTDNNYPNDKVWIDHSVIYCPFNIISIINNSFKEVPTNKNINLVVINMGSIVNAGFKNWNTEYITYNPDIYKADEEIYNFLKRKTKEAKLKELPELPEYTKISGSSIIKDGVDKMEIIFNKVIYDKIIQVLTNLYNVIREKQENQEKQETSETGHVKGLIGKFGVPATHIGPPKFLQLNEPPGETSVGGGSRSRTLNRRSKSSKRRNTKLTGGKIRNRNRKLSRRKNRRRITRRRNISRNN
jgi:hypothetical protein